jgi:hypothetical protein
MLWPEDNLYAQKLALTSYTSGGHSLGIIRLWNESHGVCSYILGTNTYGWILLLPLLLLDELGRKRSPDCFWFYLHVNFMWIHIIVYCFGVCLIFIHATFFSFCKQSSGVLNHHMWTLHKIFMFLFYFLWSRVDALIVKWFGLSRSSKCCCFFAVCTNLKVPWFYFPQRQTSFYTADLKSCLLAQSNQWND